MKFTEAGLDLMAAPSALDVRKLTCSPKRRDWIRAQCPDDGRPVLAQISGLEIFVSHAIPDDYGFALDADGAMIGCVIWGESLETSMIYILRREGT
ncbi:MAG: hypothetical protein WAV48_06730 [Candidatus Magasanikiibacteriota bacterium]